LVKRQELLAWLTREGIAEKQGEKLIASGVIRKTTLPGMTYAHYSVAQVQRDVIDKMLGDEQSEKNGSTSGAATTQERKQR
jgi:hypothetical protein